MDTTRMNDAEHTAFLAGQDAARRFCADPYSLHQDVFRAETANHKIYIGYDDVDLGIYMTVTFKHRWTRDETFGLQNRQVEMQFRSAGEALRRATRFLLKHSVPQPYCAADY